MYTYICKYLVSQRKRKRKIILIKNFYPCTVCYIHTNKTFLTMLLTHIQEFIFLSLKFL